MKQAHAAEADQGHQAGVPRGRLAAHPHEEGLHARGHDLRPQHALLRQPEGDADGRRSSSPGTPTSSRTTRTGRPTAPTSPSPPTRRRSRRRRRRRAGSGPASTTSSAPWWDCRSKASAARAPGARTTSPTRPSCRASPPTPTSTTSSRSTRRRIETMYSADLQKPAGANFWDWLKTAQFKILTGHGTPCRPGVGIRQYPARRHLPCRRAFSGGGRAAAGVRRAEDRQPGVRLVLCAGRLFRHHVRDAGAQGRHAELDAAAAAADRRRCSMAAIGPPIERLLRTVYDRDEKLPAAADLRAGADVPGRLPLRVGRQSAIARQRACWSTARWRRATSSCRSTTCW